MSLRRLANAFLGGAAAALVIALVADAANALGDTARAGVALAGLGLLAVAQALRAYLDRSPRPLIVLGLVVGLLVYLLATRA